jgi:hypothetical protein
MRMTPEDVREPWRLLVRLEASRRHCAEAAAEAVREATAKLNCAEQNSK